MFKLSLDADADAAVALEQALLALDDESVLAVSRFENGPLLWRVEAYVEAASARPGLEAVCATVPLAATPVWGEVAPTNWVRHVEEMLAPVAAGRFLVHGPHDRAKAAGHEFAIEIEAGEAFGTAHHGSTEGCLIAISHIVPALLPAVVLDLGTGSGVLAIAIAKLVPQARILATDIDPRSLEIASQNCHKNGVPESVEALRAAGLDHPRLGQPAAFDLIVANILSGPLIALAPAIARGIRGEGRMILSGLLDRQAAEVLHAYAAAGCREINRVTRGEWATLVLAKSRIGASRQLPDIALGPQSP